MHNTNHITSIKIIVKVLLYNLIFLSGNIIAGQSPNYELFLVERPKVNHMDLVGIKSVDVFKIKINRKGKIKKDSAKVFEYIYDSKNRILTGFDFNWAMVTHSGMHRNWYRFRKKYDGNFNLIFSESVDQYNVSKNKFKVVLDSFKTDFLDRIIVKSQVNRYKYDRLDREIFHYNASVSKYSIYNSDLEIEIRVDTIRPKVYEYIFNSNYIDTYFTRDSSRTVNAGFVEDVNCLNCNPRRLSNRKILDNEGRQILWNTYTRRNILHTKREFVYNELGQLRLRVDSTGWYLGNGKQTELQRISYKYEFDRVVEKKEREGVSTTTEFDDDYNVLRREITINGSIQESIRYEAKWIDEENDKKTLIITRLSNGTVTNRMYYSYSEKGILLSQMKTEGDEIQELYHFYYHY